MRSLHWWSTVHDRIKKLTGLCGSEFSNYRWRHSLMFGILRFLMSIFVRM